MTSALRAGVEYFAIVFAVGFVLGTLRVLVLVPRFGETAGAAIELPIMLAVSWFVCGWLLERFSVRRKWAHRLAMGGVAFVLLMVAELGVSILAFGRSVAEHLGTYRSSGTALGLAAQMAFAAFPLARRAPTMMAAGGCLRSPPLRPSPRWRSASASRAAGPALSRGEPLVKTRIRDLAAEFCLEASASILYAAHYGALKVAQPGVHVRLE